jgi:hypothetical protein
VVIVQNDVARVANLMKDFDGPVFHCLLAYHSRCLVIDSCATYLFCIAPLVFHYEIGI